VVLGVLNTVERVRLDCLRTDDVVYVLMLCKDEATYLASRSDPNLDLTYHTIRALEYIETLLGVNLVDDMPPDLLARLSM